MLPLSTSSITLASRNDSIQTSLSILSIANTLELSNDLKKNVNNQNTRTTSLKYTECWGADKPFAKISEGRLAKTIGLAVS